MKTSKATISLLLIAIFTFTFAKVTGQEVIYVKAAKAEMKKNSQLTTYLIEREIPGAGELTDEQLKGISQKSCAVLSEMGPEIEWVHSYVTDNKVYCLYRAANEELIREHAEKGGFPVNYITPLAGRIDPETAK